MRDYSIWLRPYIPVQVGAEVRRPQQRKCIMKALIAALALVTLISAPSFARPQFTGQTYNQSPASSNYGDNGY